MVIGGVRTSHKKRDSALRRALAEKGNSCLQPPSTLGSVHDLVLLRLTQNARRRLRLSTIKKGHGFPRPSTSDRPDLEGVSFTWMHSSPFTHRYAGKLRDPPNCLVIEASQVKMSMSYHSKPDAPIIYISTEHPSHCVQRPASPRILCPQSLKYSCRITGKTTTQSLVPFTHIRRQTQQQHKNTRTNREKETDRHTYNY